MVTESSSACVLSYRRQGPFFLVALTNLLLLMGGTMPTPLYSIYSRQFLLSPTAITVIFAVYALAVVPSLFIFGSLGDRYGRKPILLTAVLVAMLGSTFFALSQGFYWLVAGRFALGLSVGIATGNATAALFEIEPSGNRTRASVAASFSLFGGLALGPLVAGFMAQYLPAPTLSPFLLQLSLLAITAILLVTVKSPGLVRKGAGHLYRPAAPENAVKQFAYASLSAGLVYAMSGLFSSLAPTYTENIAGTSNVALGGAIPAIVVLVSAVIQPAIKKTKPTRLLVIGQFAIIMGLGLVAFAGSAHSFIVLIIGTVISGFAYGATFLGAVTTINTIATTEKRGNVTSSFYAIAYLFLGIPVVALGATAQTLNIVYAIQMYAIAESVTAVANIAWIMSFAG